MDNVEDNYDFGAQVNPIHIQDTQSKLLSENDDDDTPRWNSIFKSIFHQLWDFDQV